VSDTATAPTSTLPLYEGLFLINQQVTGGDLQAAIDQVKEILDRAEAQIVVLRKWDERKLAYEIKGQKRGLFVLAYFHARTSMLANIERDCNLSDSVIRSMVLRADHVGETELELARREETVSRTEAKLRKPAKEDEPAEDEADIDTDADE
jgi:small subunit ribosomal protein S6